jgi:hypothetical protein
VDITVPAAGTVHLTAQIQMQIYHDSGGGLSDTIWRVGITNNAILCTTNTAWRGMIPDDIDFEPAYFLNGFNQRTFAVMGPGTYTYYLNGIIDVNWHSSSDFDSARLVAVFYPS